jgi:hypothetical protein
MYAFFASWLVSILGDILGLIWGLATSPLNEYTTTEYTAYNLTGLSSPDPDIAAMTN